MADIVNKQPTSSFENEKSAQSYNEDCEDQLKLGRFMIRKLNIPKGARVLDIGCGPGTLTVEMADDVGPTGSVSGIDLGKERMKIALQTYKNPEVDSFRSNVSFALGDAHNLSLFPDDHFDYVVANTVIHFLDREKAFKAFFRVLKPGGAFAASTMSGDHYCAFLEIKREVQSRGYYRGHIEPTMDLFDFPTQSDLKKHFSGAGFRHFSFELVPSAVIYIRSFPESIQATAWANFEAEYEKLRTDRGIVVESVWLTAYATKA
ncbi:hypothetical protein SEPCBS119000_005737 [Sporothrix epigloea]|uniref:Methyltransferase domain-containing protein n=1 Tax=Sporothrix epigloea TaxID=1892477 RepID=A0ABP0E339_9PEZI